MPLYAYDCRDCGESFETLVMSGDAPACPVCWSESLERQLSLIATPHRGGGTTPTVGPCAAGDVSACCGGACQMADA